MATKKATPRKFAKLFETEEHGQILYQISDDNVDDDNNEGIRITFDPCHPVMKLCYIEYEVEKGRADSILSNITKEQVVEAVVEFKETLVDFDTHK